MYLPTSEYDLIQNYLPEYYSSKDVARLEDLTRYLDMELTREEAEEREIFEDTEVEKEFHELSRKIFQAALKNYVYIVCEQQRESCVKKYVENMHNETPVDNIRNAEPPTLENPSDK